MFGIFLLLSADVSEFRRLGLQDPDPRLFLENLTNDNGYAGSPETRNPKSVLLPVSSSGDHSAVDPPVPIPNTEVKRCSPDGSASIGCARVGRRQV